MSAKSLNNDLNRKNDWAFQWKMSFNPDPNKQAQEVIFSCKIKKLSQPSLIFNNKNIVTQSPTQKYFWILSWISRNIIWREYSVKLTKQLFYYGRSTTHCRDCIYLQFISPSLDLISTMVTSYMIKHIKLHFTKN